MTDQVKWHAQGHTTYKQLSQESKSGLLSSSSRYFVLYSGLILPGEPRLLSNIMISVTRLMRWCVFSASRIAGTLHSISVFTVLSLLRDTFPFRFSLSLGKSVPCQDIWGGTENTVLPWCHLQCLLVSYGTWTGLPLTYTGWWDAFWPWTEPSLPPSAAVSNKVYLWNTSDIHLEELMVWKLI